MRLRILSLLFVTILAFGCKSETSKPKEVKKELVAGKDSLIYPEEVHFKSLRQITFGVIMLRLIGVLMINSLFSSRITKLGVLSAIKCF